MHALLIRWRRFSSTCVNLHDFLTVRDGRRVCGIHRPTILQLIAWNPTIYVYIYIYTVWSVLGGILYTSHYHRTRGQRVRTAAAVVMDRWSSSLYVRIYYACCLRRVGARALESDKDVSPLRTYINRKPSIVIFVRIHEHGRLPRIGCTQYIPIVWAQLLHRRAPLYI